VSFTPSIFSALKKLTRESGLALAAGEILWLNGGWYVTSGGLLRIAKENIAMEFMPHGMSKLSDGNEQSLDLQGNRLQVS